MLKTQGPLNNLTIKQIFCFNDKKRERDVGGGGWERPPGSLSAVRRGELAQGAGRQAPAPREGKSFRPLSESLRSFGRAGRRQSQAYTAPAWARRGAAAGGLLGGPRRLYAGYTLRLGAGELGLRKGQEEEVY